MTVFVALLRGINVGGHARVAMPALRELLESLGYQRVRTYLQSGNVVFEVADQSTDHVAESVTSAVAKEMDLTISVLIRTAREIDRVAEGNPFLGGKRDPSYLHVTFLESTPSPEKSKAFRTPEGQTDELQLIDREVYLYCPGGYGKTKLNNTFIERRLGVPATTRNWKTVTSLQEMA